MTKRTFAHAFYDEVCELEDMIESTALSEDLFPPSRRRKTFDVNDTECLDMFMNVTRITEKQNIMDEEEDDISRPDIRVGFLSCCPEHYIQICVKRMSVTSTNLTVDYNTSRIRDIKFSLYQLGAPTPDFQRLVFHGRNLPDNLYVRDSDIKDGDVLHLVQALTGGCKSVNKI